MEAALDRVTPGAFAAQLRAITAARADLTPLQLAIFDAVLTAPGITMQEMVDAIYGSREDGGPLHPEGSISTTASKMRPCLLKHGLTMGATNGGPGARWHIRSIPRTGRGKQTSPPMAASGRAAATGSTSPSALIPA